MANQDTQSVTMEQSFKNNVLVTFRSSREVKWGCSHNHYKQSFHLVYCLFVQMIMKPSGRKQQTFMMSQVLLVKDWVES